MAAVSTVGDSGNVDIDGLLSGYRWASGSITYSFTSSSSQYGYSVPGFQALNAAQQEAAELALANFAAVANLTFTEISGTGTIRFAESDDAGTAYAYYPHISEEGGDAFFNHFDYNAPDQGTYAYLTFVHELGHALGLDHGQDGTGALPTDHDSLEYSVMTYRSFVGADLNGYTASEGSYPATLMLADIAALQYMYGANYTTNSGNSTYEWDATTGELTINGASKGQSVTNTVFMTVWDGGGTDTYDFSNYSSNLKVDLRPGEWTTTSTSQLADLGFGEFARGNIANAWLHQNNTASLIENATGGSGSDLIVGNDAANVLKGGNGNDSLKGLAGNDTMWGGQGNDTCYFSVASTTCTVTYDASAQAYIVVTVGGGTDTVKEVELFAFTDKTVNAGVIEPDSPVLVSATPADGATGVKDNANIVLTFSETVVAGTGKVVIRQSNGTILQSFDVGASPAGLTMSGNTVTIDPTGYFLAGTAYYVTIENGAFEDVEGKAYSGIFDKGDLNFTVETGVTRGTSQAEIIGGTNDADRIYAGGGNDSVMGRNGNDLLDGGSGADNLAGGRGDDIYVVGSAQDKVTEAESQGTDLVKSKVSFTLSANVEGLTLTGSGNIDGTGNSLANTITGNSGNNKLVGNGGNDGLVGGGGNDRLDGGTGRDTLTGGSGADKFVFTASVKTSNADVVTDFDVTADTIVLSRAVFTALAVGTISDADAAFATDGDAASAHIIYDSATGVLFYDRDGSGSAGDVKIATLATGLAFTQDNFLIV